MSCNYRNGTGQYRLFTEMYSQNKIDHNPISPKKNSCSVLCLFIYLSLSSRGGNSHRMHILDILLLGCCLSNRQLHISKLPSEALAFLLHLYIFLKISSGGSSSFVTIYAIPLFSPGYPWLLLLVMTDFFNRYPLIIIFFYFSFATPFFYYLFKFFVFTYERIFF